MAPLPATKSMLLSLCGTKKIEMNFVPFPTPLPPKVTPKPPPKSLLSKILSFRAGEKSWGVP